MKAVQVLEILGKKHDDYEFEDFDLRGLSLDSRTVSKDYCFFAIKGTNSDGHDFIESAINKGARLIVYEKGNSIESSRLSKTVFFVEVDNVRKSLGKIASAYFGHPSDKLQSIGITGTNGKTTVSYIIEHILKQNGINSGLIGTIQYKISDHIVPAVNTTPDAIKIQHLLHHMVDHNLTYNIMEVSSHALDQFRIEGIKFKTAVFTNLTRDHLNYHKSFEQYFKAKAELFTSLDEKATAVINIDDEYGRKLEQLVRANFISYAIDDQRATLRAEDIVLGLEQTTFTLIMPEGHYEIQTSLIGQHNIYNALGAIGAARAEGISILKIADALKSMEPVRGRLERIKSDKPFETFIDYAHTDDALKNVLNTLQELKPKRIITVFGCGGDRDKEKRFLMGKIASELSDYVIVTNDNPRSEEPQSIIDQITKGFVEDFKSYEIIADRDKAIKKACSQAEKGDFVLIAGKGHETSQIFKDKTIEFDDRKSVLEALENR